MDATAITTSSNVGKHPLLLKVSCSVLVVARHRTLLVAIYGALLVAFFLVVKPEDQAHIKPTAIYDEVICLGFQHDITTLQLQGYTISYNRQTTALIQYIRGRYMSEYRLQSNA